MCHGVPGVLKRTHISWASQGSYIAASKLHIIGHASSVSSVSHIAINAPLLLPFMASPEKFPSTSRPSRQLHTQFRAAHSSSCPTFFPRQKMCRFILSSILPARDCFFISSYTHNSKLYALYLAVPPPRSKKWANPFLWGLLAISIPKPPELLFAQLKVAHVCLVLPSS